MDEKEFLKSYNSNEYEKPSVAVDMVVMAIRNTKAKTYRNLDNKELQILLVKRNQHPFCDKWALPGGFCNMTETLTQAAMRVLESKTSIKNAYLEQLYTWSDVNRDPRMRIISSSYLSILNDADATILPENAAWFTVSMTEAGESHDRILYLKLTGPVTISSEIKVTASIESNIVDSDYTIIKANDLAFDHAKIIAYAIERIRNRVEYIPIASRFLPTLFVRKHRARQIPMPSISITAQLLGWDSCRSLAPSQRTVSMKASGRKPNRRPRPRTVSSSPSARKARARVFKPRCRCPSSMPKARGRARA